MDAVEGLIAGWYADAVRMDWAEFRERGLAGLCSATGASAALWWTHGESGRGGVLNQAPKPWLSPTVVAEMAAELPPGPLTSPDPTVAGVRHRHRQSALNSVILLRARPALAPALIGRLATHLAEAGDLSMHQFIRRDDFLAALGRPSRGSAALIAADGTVFAASDQFRPLVGANGALPFKVPRAVLTEGGDFTHNGIHLRVARCGPLYLLHARKPLPLDQLSPREQEIARALSCGKTLKTIARQYGIALSTVANHTTRIYRKLAIYRREELMEVMRNRPSTLQ